MSSSKLFMKASSKTEPSPQDIGVVGAGPVGSYLAIKLRQRGHTVTIYEKREYTRTTTVFLNPDELESPIQINKREKINELQTRLHNFATSIGVKIVRHEVIDINDVPHDTVILATGTKCNIRDAIFGEPYRSSVHNKKVVVCRYTAENTPNKTPLFDWYKTLKILEGVADEQINGNDVTLVWEAPLI